MTAGTGTLFRVAAGLCLGSCLAVLAPSVAAQSTRKLSGPLPRTPGNVQEHWTTRDGAWCVYLANPEIEAPALYSVSLSRPRQPIELSRGIHGPISRQGVRVPAAGTNVVFSAGGDLHAVPIDGSVSPVLIGGTSVTGVAVGDTGHALSFDGTHVVFWTRAPDGPFELRSASLAQPGTTVLLGAGPGAIGAFAITADGAGVVYTADQDSLGVRELFAVALDGSAPARKLSGTLASDRDVFHFALAPDSARVAYVADAEENDVLELFSAPLDASASPVKLSGTLVAGGDVAYDLAVLPGGLAVYLAGALVNGSDELFSVPVDGSAPAARLNGPLAARYDVELFRATPDGTKVVYVADEDVVGDRALYLAPADGSAPSVRLDGPPVARIDERGFRMSADGTFVVYRADAGGVVDLYAVPLAAGAPAVLVSDSVAPENTFELSPDGTRVVYRAESDWPEPDELRSAPTDGSAASALLCRMWFGFVSGLGFSIAPDSGTVLYRTDEEHERAVELFRRTIDGSDAPLPLSMPLVPGPVVGDAQVVGIGSGHAVYLAWSRSIRSELWTVSLRGSPAPRRIPVDAHEDYQYFYAELDPSGRWIILFVEDREGFYRELWTAPVDGSRPAVRLSAPALESAAYWNNVPEHALDASGERLAFATETAVFAAPVDGSAPARRLTQRLGGRLGVSEIAIDPAGTRVVYRTWDYSSRLELFVAAWDGSTAPRRLVASPGNGHSLYGSRISPRGDRVVYVADQDKKGVDELYSVPIDGSAAAVKLSGTLVKHGDVVSVLLLSPDGERVVYAADAGADELFGIYSAPLDGSAPPAALYLPLAPGRISFSELAITAHGRRVTFLADPEGDGSDELFSAPITGGPPVRLNAPLAAGGSVQPGYRLDARGKRLAYLADQDADEVYELFGARADGRGAPVALCRASHPDADVRRGFALSPDGSLVVFAADARVDEVVELFAVPIAGGAPPRPLHRPLGAREDVLAGFDSFAFTRDSRHVVYSADALTDDVFELYESVLPPTTRQVARPR